MINVCHKATKWTSQLDWTLCVYSIIHLDSYWGRASDQAKSYARDDPRNDGADRSQIRSPQPREVLGDHYILEIHPGPITSYDSGYPCSMPISWRNRVFFLDGAWVVHALGIVSGPKSPWFYGKREVKVSKISMERGWYEHLASSMGTHFHMRSRGGRLIAIRQPITQVEWTLYYIYQSCQEP